MRLKISVRAQMDEIEDKPNYRTTNSCLKNLITLMEDKSQKP